MAKGGADRTSKAQLETEKKQVEALNLRLAGVGYRQIASELGYSGPSGAHAAVMSALDKARSEPANNLRELMIARLDELLASTWEAALAGDVDSINAVLRIEERRARLLGMDRRETPITVKLPKLDAAQDGIAVVSALLEKATNGELLPEEAAKLSALVQSFMKVAETTELAERIKMLEEKINGTA